MRLRHLSEQNFVGLQNFIKEAVFLTDTISATQVKELRERTGAGMMECRKALVEASGDMEKAIVTLREKGILKAQTKAGREATDGRVEGYVSADSRVAALVEINCETDFVAKTDEFKKLALTLAEQAAIETIQFDKLLESPYLGDKTKTIQQVIQENIAKLGENIVVRRIARLEGAYVEMYIHSVGGGKMGTMVELFLANANALTDPSVKTLARNLAMQVAAAYPKYVCREEVPVNILEEEKRIYRAQAESEGKPPQVLDKIALGKLNKFYQTVCLLDQSYIKEMERSVNDIVKETADKLKTTIEVKRFARFALGEKE